MRLDSEGTEVSVERRSLVTERLRSSLPAIVCPECGALILDSLGGSHTAGELMQAHAHDCPGCEPCRECNGLEALCNDCGGCGFVPSSTVKENRTP